MSSIDLVQQLAQQQHVFCLRWNNHSSNLLHYLQHLQENESLTNVTLVCEGGELFYAHQSVLSASSPYFESIFNSCLHHGANHPQGGTLHPIIFLKDVKGYEMRGLIDFMYRGEVNISQGCLNGFLKTAESLGIRGLTEGDEQDEDGSSGHVDPIDALASAFRGRACKRRRRNGSNGSRCGSGDGNNSCYQKKSNSTSREREIDRDSETEVQATECSSSRSVPSPNVTRLRRNSATSSCTTTITNPRTVIQSSPSGVISLVKKDKYQTSSASISASSSPASSCPCPKNLAIDPRELLEPLVHHDEHEHENESSADDHDHDNEHDHDERDRDHHEDHKAASETLANLSGIGLHTKIFKTSSTSSTNCSSTTTSSSTLIMRAVTSPSNSPNLKNHRMGCIRVSSKPINIIGSHNSGRDHHSHHRKSLGSRSSKVNSHSYVCSLCSHEYPRESTLLNHLKVYHKNNV